MWYQRTTIRSIYGYHMIKLCFQPQIVSEVATAYSYSKESDLCRLKSLSIKDAPKTFCDLKSNQQVYISNV